MALLNEKRNRIPLVATLPVTGDDGGIRGQMRMSTAGTTNDTVYCLVSDTGGTPSTLTLTTMTFDSKLFGVAGDAITIEFADGGALSSPTVVVTGPAIVVSGDITTNGTLNEQEVVDAINADAAASALVTASTTSGATLVAITVATSLAGGVGAQATGTINVDITATAVTGGSAGNDISVEVVEVAGQALRVTVSGKAIVISGDATSTTLEMVAAINASSLASKLVIASGGSTQVLVTAAAIALAGGLSNSVWSV